MSDGPENLSANEAENGPRKISGPASSFRIDANEQAEIAGIDEPGALADFGFWAKMATWTVEEAVALSFNRNPEVVTWVALQPYPTVIFAENFRRLRKLALRASEAGQLTDPCPPLEFIAWMRRLGLDFPAHGADAVARHVEQAAALRNVPTFAHAADGGAEGVVTSKSFNTLLKLFGGIVVSAYRYNPSAKKSEVPGEIQTDLNLLGIEIGLDTIRKYIHLGVSAAEIVDWLPK